MMLYVHFVFVGEGPSDDGLVPHLEDLCIMAGADEVNGVAPHFSRLGTRVGRDVGSKVKAALLLEPTANMVFIHRDADARDADPRHEEIKSAVSGLQVPLCVRVVPVQELESWLLLNESEIRRVAENPAGRVNLNLPTAHNVENLANPKEALQEAILLASEATGRRRQRLATRFDDQRRLLLERLNPKTSLKEVPAWIRLTQDVSEAINALRPH